MRRLMKFLAVAGIGIGGIGGLGSPASADPPVEFEFSDTFPDINPCTDTPMEVTIVFAVREHEHRDRFVIHASKTGSTNDGYVMEHGAESLVFNGQVFRQAFTDNWHNDDGSKFQARGVIVDSTDGLRVDRFTLRCLDT